MWGDWLIIFIVFFYDWLQNVFSIVSILFLLFGTIPIYWLGFCILNAVVNSEQYDTELIHIPIANDESIACVHTARSPNAIDLSCVFISFVCFLFRFFDWCIRFLSSHAVLAVDNCVVNLIFFIYLYFVLLVSSFVLQIVFFSSLRRREYYYVRFISFSFLF